MKLNNILSAVALAAVSISSQAAVIDFESATPGSKANGYTLQGVSFSDTVGSDLSVGDFGEQSHGNALAVFNDDNSKLAMSFAVANGLSLDFGNDDACCSNAGDRAWLNVFMGNTLVGTSFVTMNRDDVMNQTISIAGVGNFNNAVFYFGNVAGGAINLIEVIDNVNVSTVAAVPEPETYALMLAGLGVIGFVARRRRA